MSLPDHHPFSLAYTANPRPVFADVHRDNRYIEIPEMNAVLIHGYEAVRAFCDHPKVVRNPTDAGIIDPEGKRAREERWPTLEAAGNAGMIRPDGRFLFRELLAPDFKPRMIRRMADTVHEVVHAVCAPLRTAEALDVVELVQEVPLRVISRLLGIEEETSDASLFLTCAPDYFRGVSPLSADADRDKAETAALQMFEILDRTIEKRRLEPRTDLVTQVIEVADRLGDVAPADLVRALVVLVAAGTDTTRLSTSLAVKTLLSHPEETEALRADRSRVPNAVMECLRYEGPTKCLLRASVDDIEFEGRTLPKKKLVLLSIMGAGWDPRAFPEPGRFDVDRDLKGSLSFGFGSGYCLGVHLARLQVATLLDYFLDHLPATATFDEGEITWDPGNLFLREITSLPIRVQ